MTKRAKLATAIVVTSLLWVGLSSIIAIQYLPLLWHQTIALCQGIGSWTGQELLPHQSSWTIFAVLGVGFVWIISIGYMLIKNTWMRHHLIPAHHIPRRLQIILKRERLWVKTILLEYSGALAFCAGFRQPRLYISTGLLTQLTEPELILVLRHERFHLLGQDTRWSLMLQILVQTMPFLPILSSWLQEYRLTLELEADQACISSSQDRSRLAHIFKKLLQEPQQVFVPNVVSFLDSYSLETRVRALLGLSDPIPQFRWSGALISVLVGLGGLVIAVTPLQATEIHNDQQDIMVICVSSQNCNTICSASALMSKERVNQSLNSSQSQIAPFSPALSY